jgi:adenylate kinase
MNIIIFGPQGVGKGTQAKLLAKHYNLKHLSTGDVLRSAIVDKTPMGTKAEAYIEKGEFVPDNVVNEIIENQLFKTETGWILDGYPRNLAQAEYLDLVLDKAGQKIDLVIDLSAPKQILKNRMMARKEIENRLDDVEQIIERRLELFENKTKPVLDFYNKRKMVRTLNGVGSIKEVNKYIICNIDALKLD